MREGRKRSSVRAALAVAALSFVLLFLLMSREFSMFDEGVIVLDATRVLDGEIIHRDFYSSYGPGQYYLLAGMFRIFGTGFLTERLYDLVVRAAGLGALFFIIRARCPLLVALLFTAIGGMWLVALGTYLYPIFPCIPLSLVGSYFVTRMPSGAAAPLSLAAGICAGLAALFRYEVGFFLLVAHVASITALVFLMGPVGARTRRWLTVVIVYAAGAALMFLPAAILILGNGALPGFLADIVDYPSKYYALMRGLPFPGPAHLVRAAAVYLPLLATGLAALELFRIWRSRRFGDFSETGRWDRDTTAYLIVFGSTAAMLFLKGVVRVSQIHMLLGILPALVVLAVLISRWWSQKAVMRAFAVVIATVALLPAAGSMVQELQRSFQVKDRSMAGWLGIKIGLTAPSPSSADICDTAAASGIAKLEPDYARVANYLAAHSDKNERILAALERHDRIVGNSPGLYFAANRRPGSHWAQFDPGLQTRADIQSAIIDELRRNAVRWVVRDANYDRIVEPNGSAQSSGVKLLDDYLDLNYRRVAAYGDISIWLAAGVAAPAISPGAKCEAEPV